MTDNVTVSLSIVSHGQGRLVANLLDDIATGEWSNGFPFEIIVTLNIPEDEVWLDRAWPFPLKTLRNERPKGFGANHNQAFHVARGEFFAVVNPDIRLGRFRIAELIRALDSPDCGACAPLILAPNGAIEDSARRFPTPGRLLVRKFLRQTSPDYANGPGATAVDWLAGMFVLFRSAVYREIGGYDERYFMYFEDVEICRLLHRRDFDTLWIGSTEVIHDASRASRRSIRYLKWHVTSMLRYWFDRSRR